MPRLLTATLAGLFTTSIFAACPAITFAEDPAAQTAPTLPRSNYWPPASADAVRVEIFEACPSHKQLPSEAELQNLGEAAFAWSQPVAYLHTLPIKYTDGGVRDAWTAPALVRMTTLVELPAGKLEWLVRSPGPARVWIDDEIVVSLEKASDSFDAHRAVQPLPDPPSPGGQPPAWGTHETTAHTSIDAAGTYRITCEVLIGREKRRVEPCECTVAYRATPDDDYRVIGAAGEDLPLTPSAIGSVQERLSGWLSDLSIARRRELAAAEDAYWQDRHERATALVAARGLASPPSDAPEPTHPIDRFLEAKRRSGSVGGVSPRRHVESQRDSTYEAFAVLQERCFSCHGNEGEGGLNLKDPAARLGHGESGLIAIRPGDASGSELVRRIGSEDESERMPPDEPLTAEEIQSLTAWVDGGAKQEAELLTAEFEPARPRADDAMLLRRICLDLIGILPDADLQAELLADRSDSRVEHWIDRLLSDPRFADHWISYWLDLTAESPSILKASLNNTGPFRWFLHDALTDDWPIDRIVTELILQRGSDRLGGPAGFGLSVENDVPAAARSVVLSGAFLGEDLRCARCHDAPYHPWKQEQLFAMGAMLQGQAIEVPSSSSVPPEFFAGRSDPRPSIVKVTLEPGSRVEPAWPFGELVAEEAAVEWAACPDDPRHRLAAAVTSPEAGRFEQVFANSVWQRLIGTGIVAEPGDWTAEEASHPELLRHLGDELIRGGYSLKHLLRHIMTSAVYQATAGDAVGRPAEVRSFAGPARRRLTAEQLVDSLAYLSGNDLRLERLTFDPEGIRTVDQMIDLGMPQRAWQIVPLANERDRPSLSLPRAVHAVAFLETFGWPGARTSAVHNRDVEATPLQPGMLGGSTLALWTSTAAAGSRLAEAAWEAKSPEQLLDWTFQQYLGRTATAAERECLRPALAEGFESRRLPPAKVRTIQPPPQLETVSWSNHLDGRANEIRLEEARRAEAGDGPDPRMDEQWLGRYEDIVWSLINSPEFAFVP